MHSFAYHIADQFGDVTDQLFESFTENLHEQETSELQYNYCPDCKLPMELSTSEYQCKHCGLNKRNDMGDIGKVCETAANNVIRMGAAGVTRGKYYNVNNDYSHTQYTVTINQLMQNLSMHPGAFPINVLKATAERYNSIQKNIKEDNYDPNGQVKGQKKFVRRGSIRDEVLAAILKFECKRAGLNRKDKFIAAFMNLPTEGFSRGEGIIRNFEAGGKISDIPVNDEPVDGFIDRYLESLNIDNPQYNAFIRELVDRSEDKKLGMNSQISSKVVGAIWIVIRSCKLNINAHELEKAADNTKKNTFIKFYNIVLNNRPIFNDIFVKYNVSYP